MCWEEYIWVGLWNPPTFFNIFDLFLVQIFLRCFREAKKDLNVSCPFFYKKKLEISLTNPNFVSRKVSPPHFPSPPLRAFVRASSVVFNWKLSSVWRFRSWSASPKRQCLTGAVTGSCGTLLREALHACIASVVAFVRARSRFVILGSRCDTNALTSEEDHHCGNRARPPFRGGQLLLGPLPVFSA